MCISEFLDRVVLLFLTFSSVTTEEVEKDFANGIDHWLPCELSYEI